MNFGSLNSDSFVFDQIDNQVLEKKDAPFVCDVATPLQHLFVPGTGNTSPKSPKLHTTNPNPFSIVPPAIELNPVRPIRRSLTRKVKVSNKRTETERDLIFETEEQTILSEIIEYKTRLLRKVDQELALAKGKLAGINKQCSMRENDLLEIPTGKNFSADELIELLKNTGEISEDADFHSWKLKTNSFSQEPQSAKVQSMKRLVVQTWRFSLPDMDLTSNHPVYRFYKSLTSNIASIDKYNTLRKKVLLKKINYLFSCAVTRENNGEILPNLAEFCYDLVFNRYQDTVTSEKKFLELICSSIKNSNSLRISGFVRMLGLGSCIDQESFIRPLETFRFSVSLLSALSRSQLGIVLAEYETPESLYIPTLRATECIKNIFFEILPVAKLQEVVLSIEYSSKQDLMKVNPHGVVTQDYVLCLAIEEHEKYTRGIVEAVSLISKGLDLEAKGTVHISELAMMIRHIVPAKLPLLVDSQRNYSLALSSMSDHSFITIEALTEYAIKTSLVSIQDVNNYLSQVKALESMGKDYIKSLLFKNYELLTFVTCHKAQLGVSPEVEELWRVRITLLDQEEFTIPRSLFLSFYIFIQELQRLSHLIK